MEAKVGARFASAVCSSEVIVIHSPGGDLDITCGGSSLVPAGEEADDSLSLDSAHAAGTQLGKRYVNEDGTLEILCVKPGEGSLALDGEPLSLKDAKPLPSSD